MKDATKSLADWKAEASSEEVLPDKFLLRYPVVTLLFLLWVRVWLLLDDVYNLWILVVLPIFCSGAVVAIYFFAALLESIIKAQVNRLLAVVLGPLVVLLLVSLLTSSLNGLSFTVDYARFLLHRGGYLSQIPTSTEFARVPHFWYLKSNGMFIGRHAMSAVAYDPSGEITLNPDQRSQKWVSQAESQWTAGIETRGFDNRYLFHSLDEDAYKKHVAVKDFGGGFYLVTLEWWGS